MAQIAAFWSRRGRLLGLSLSKFATRPKSPIPEE